MRVALGGGAIACGGLAAFMALDEPASAIIPIVVAAVLLVCVWLFHSLTVKVSREQIMLTFGVGLIRKRFTVAEIESAAIVRNHWYYGWGIKLTPHGWLYNVSGLDAVQIQRRNGRKTRIGTDEPVELLAAIASVIEKSS